MWLALDLVAGDTLARLLAAPGGRPPLADVVDWIAQTSVGAHLKAQNSGQPGHQ
jgi:hypothetical protein